MAQATGLPWFMNWINRNKLLVVTYHGIYDGPKETGSFPDTFVHRDDLKSQLQEIKRRFRIVSPDNLRAAIEQKSPLPPYSALITFDDGYESFYRLAFPVLQSLGIRTIVFIPTQYVENKKPFYYDLAWAFFKYCNRDRLLQLKEKLKIPGSDGITDNRSVLVKMKQMSPAPRDAVADWMEKTVGQDVLESPRIINCFKTMNEDELLEIVRGGHLLGGHTHSHMILNRIPNGAALKKEILENKARLEILAKKPCRFFAYPNGGKNDFADEHKRFLKDSGYIAAFSLTQNRAELFDLMDISRINVSPEDTLQTLTLRCSGIYSLKM